MSDIKQDRASVLAQMDSLNAAVEAAFVAREEFAKAHMHLFADFQIGQEVVSVTNDRTYTVSEHYLSPWLYERSNEQPWELRHNVHCRISGGPGLVSDNTSRHGGMHPYVSRADAVTRSPEYISKLRYFAAKKGK